MKSKTHPLYLSTLAPLLIHSDSNRFDCGLIQQVRLGTLISIVSFFYTLKTNSRKKVDLVHFWRGNHNLGKKEQQSERRRHCRRKNCGRKCHLQIHSWWEGTSFQLTQRALTHCCCSWRPHYWRRARQAFGDQHIQRQKTIRYLSPALTSILGMGLVESGMCTLFCTAQNFIWQV